MREENVESGMENGEEELGQGIGTENWDGEIGTQNWDGESEAMIQLKADLASGMFFLNNFKVK